MAKQFGWETPFHGHCSKQLMRPLPSKYGRRFYDIKLWEGLVRGFQVNLFGVLTTLLLPNPTEIPLIQAPVERVLLICSVPKSFIFTSEDPTRVR